MDLEESARRWVFDNLPHDRADPATVAALRSKSTGELFTLFFNWADRLISPQPRKVMRSAAFDQNPEAVRRSRVIQQLVADVKQGNDLTKYLSRRVTIGFQPAPNPAKKQLNKLRHLDLLMNDWRVHHLHLSSTVERDGFVERDDPLLFAIFRADKAYFLDIRSHKTFADDHLARIAVDEWPEADLFLELKGIRAGSGGPPSSDERSQLRKAGVVSHIQIGDRVFVPPGILSTAGTSASASMRAKRIIRTMVDFERQLKTDPGKFRGFLSRNGLGAERKIDLEFAIFAKGFGVIDKTSRTPIRLG